MAKTTTTTTAPLVCTECGTALPEGSRSHARYCSSTCRSRASRARASAPAELPQQPTTSAEYVALLARLVLRVINWFTHLGH
jgi:hypothetical protein